MNMSGSNFIACACTVNIEEFGELADTVFEFLCHCHINIFEHVFAYDTAGITHTIFCCNGFQHTFFKARHIFFQEFYEPDNISSLGNDLSCEVDHIITVAFKCMRCIQRNVRAGRIPYRHREDQDARGENLVKIARFHRLMLKPYDKA